MKTQSRPSAPPGPFRESFWRSPIRGPWLTSVFGLVLLAGIPILFATGLFSYAAYNPNLASVNDETPNKGLLGFYLFSWPTHPIWLYRVNQGTHVTLGLMLVPIVLFKLWSVLPKLFEWPPVRSLAHILERVSLIMVVGGVIFEFATGILNIQTYYVFPGNFYLLHFYGGWVFIAGFVIHVVLKLPAMIRALRSHSMFDVLRTDLAGTRPEPLDAEGLVALRPDPPTISRRGVLAFAGGASALVGALVVGQSLGGPFRKTALLAPHGQEMPGANPDFQVNMTAAGAGVTSAEADAATWKLTLLTEHITGTGVPPGGTDTVKTVTTLTRADLLNLEQHTVSLPIACVEGWSTDNQTWTGVRLSDLAKMAGVPQPLNMLTRSLQRGGAFSRAVMSVEQTMDPDSLLALKVNGADLTLDHGYPARVIVPDAPGVHNTKWVASLTFRELRMRWFRRLYGSNPLHLLVMIACFALAGYAATKLRAGGDYVGILVWLGGAVIGHDLILFPLYAIADRSVMTVFRRRPPALPAVPWINYLRVPVVFSGILLLIWFPLIFRLPKQFTADHTGLPLSPYLGHWLAVTGALFLLSAAAYALRLCLRPRRRPQKASDRWEPVPAPRPLSGTGPIPDPANQSGRIPQLLSDPQDWRGR